MNAEELQAYVSSLNIPLIAVSLTRGSQIFLNGVDLIVFASQIDTFQQLFSGQLSVYQNIVYSLHVGTICQ